MLEKLKKYLKKFNQIENEEDISKKKKFSVIYVLIIVIFIVVLLCGYLDVFNKTTQNNSTSNSNNDEYIYLEENFFIEDFVFDKLIAKTTNSSFYYKGLNNIVLAFNNFFNSYNSFELTKLETCKFQLINEEYIFQDDYLYEFDLDGKTLSVFDNNELVLIYQNKNNIIQISIDEETIQYELNSLTYISSNDNTYLFELEENEWLLSYFDDEENEFVEHYNLDNCSLIEIELEENDNVYHYFIYEEIKNKTSIEKNKDGYVLFDQNNEKVNESLEDFNFDLMILNYYFKEIEVFVDSKSNTTTAFVILNSYYVLNGFPFNFKK